MAVNDCFTIGATVLCTTYFNEEIEGEVLAFDYNTKMLILKCQSKNSEKLNDVYVLNLSLCSNVQVIKECNGTFVEEPQKLNLEQLNLRIRKTVQHRQTYLQSQNVNVTPEGQELYRAIAKQFKYNEVSWKGPNIAIFNEVTIAPPYRVDNVSSCSNKSLCNYIKKMIEQFGNSRALPENTSILSPTSTLSSTTSSLSSSTPSNSLVVGNSPPSNATSSASPVPAN